MNDRKQKILAFFLGLLTVILLIEVGLRIAGSVHKKSTTFYKRSLISRGDNHYIILCEGDSYTRGMGAPEGDDYANQLENLLNSQTKRKTFTVINKGIAAQNTTHILNRLQSDVDATKPDLIILLMGVSNEWNHWGYLSYKNERTLFSSLHDFLYRIRIYKLTRLLFNDIRGKQSKASDFGSGQVHIKEVENEDIIQFKEKIEANPNNSRYYYDIGLCYRRQGKLEEAIRWLEKGIKINPRDSRNYHAIGWNYCLLGNYEEAIRWLEKGIKINPREGRSYCAISLVYIYQGNYEEAIRWLEKGIKINPRVHEPIEGMWREPLGYRHLISYYYRIVGNDEKAVMKLNELERKIEGVDAIDRNRDKDNDKIYAKITKFLREFAKNNPDLVISHGIEKIRKAKGKCVEILRMVKNSPERRGLRDWAKSDIKKIIEICHTQGIEIILQTYPNKWDYDDKMEINKVITEVAKEYSVSLVDNYQLFNEMWDKGGKRSDYFEFPSGYGHCNAKGYGMMAMNVYNKIMEEEIFEAN